MIALVPLLHLQPAINLHLGDYRSALAHVRADLIVCSPPYNIGSPAECK